MSSLAIGCRVAITALVLGLSTGGVCAQVAPIQYWVPGGQFGFGDGVANAASQGWTSALTYDDGSPRGFSSRGFSYPVSAFSSGLRFGGLGASSGLIAEGAQYGYSFKGLVDSPVTLYGGAQSLRTAPDAFSALTMPGYDSSRTVATSFNAGVEFRPSSNLSLSLSAGYTQQNLGAVDSDIRSNLLPGETPLFSSGRR